MKRNEAFEMAQSESWYDKSYLRVITDGNGWYGVYYGEGLPQGYKRVALYHKGERLS